MKNIFLIVLCLSWGQSLFAHAAEYTIRSKDNERLGYLNVTRIITNGKEEILVQSRIEVKMLFTIVISYTLHSVFQDHKLISNEIVTYRNHNEEDEMSTKRLSEGYIFKKNEKESKVKDFEFCESMMYFNEPTNIPEAYSEFDGVFKRVKHIKTENRYDLINPLNSRVSNYFYRDGVLERAIVHSPLLTLFLYRKS